MARATYVDANVLISAFRGEHAATEAALAILGDAGRSFVSSEYLRLETLPKPSFHGKTTEVAFLNAYFDAARLHVSPTRETARRAIDLATRYDLAPMDALHVSAALAGEADELVTVEKPTKPLFRVRELKVVSIYQS